MSPALPLTLLEDYERLHPASVDVFLAERPEARTTPVAASLIPADELSAWLSTRTGGPAPPPWRSGEGLGWRGETTVCRMRDVRWAPGSGAVIDRHGVVIRCTVGEAHLNVGDLARLPGFAAGADGAPVLAPATAGASAPAFDRATVWLPWGGQFNYGHFLIDGLSSLLAVEELGLLQSHGPVAPPLAAWQRGLLGLAFPGVEVRETPAPLAEIDEVLFATSMNHFLHIPNAILGRLRDRILERAPPPAPDSRRVYLSRRGTSMRVMVNERALEKALAARGFRIVRPETLSVADQIAAVRGAEVVVGASGAQLANALFLPPGGRVIEIQPQNFTSVWTPMMAWVTERDWAGYFAPSPLPPSRAPITARLKRGFKFAWAVPLDDFLPFLDARL